MSDKQHALYLVKDGSHPALFHGDDVEAAKANGWEQPDFPRGTGTEWNREEDLEQQDAAAEVGKAVKEADAKKADKKAAETEKADKAKK